MGLALKPDRLRRYRDIAALVIKYGRSDLLFHAGVDRETAAALAQDLEQMGPTFVKVGQLLSTRGDLLSPDTIRELSRLQDDVEPFSFGDVERIVSDELGVRLSKAFSRFEARPLAAGSLGQVHRAALRAGREVAVKVQRPNIRDEVLTDMASMADVADLLDAHTETGRRLGLRRMVDELRASLLAELDYAHEAQNMIALRGNLSRFRRIVISEPILDYSTARVLTMEYISGVKITEASPLVLAESHATALADELFRAYLHQVILDGLFHADPHPGNVLLTADGRIALLDLGMASRLSAEVQQWLLQLFIAIADGRAEHAADIALQMGERVDGHDEPSFRRRIAEVITRTQGTTIAEVPAGQMLLQVAHAASDAGVRLPSELTLLGKTLLNLDEIGRTLSPGFDVHESLKRNANELMMERMRRSVSPSAAFSTLLEAKSFAERLPGRVNRVLESLVNQDLKVRVELIDEGAVLEGLQKVANRITLGLLLAAMIVGAAMLMRVDTTFRIFGYPGLAMLLFLGAALGAAWLAVGIIRSDRPA
jgi:predicted unusual protein kinase regulating ubiquinone biosynthesis (AarF/ABC1/UbiB family)